MSRPSESPSNGRRSLAGMASPLVVGRVASMAVTFGLPLFLARLLDAGAFGAYKQLFLVAQTVLLMCQLGLTQSLYYFLPREREAGVARGAYLTQTLAGLALIATIVAFALRFLGARITGHLGDGELRALSGPLALLASGMLLSSPLEAALTSEGRVSAAALVYVVSDGSRAALLLVGARVAGLAGVAWAGALWAGLRVATLGLMLAARLLPLALPHRGRLREQLAYALPFAGSVLLFVAQRQFVQYAVAASFDAKTFALFSVASFHLPVIDIVYGPICEVLMVQLGRSRMGRPPEGLAAWDDAVEKLAALLWPAAVGAWLFGGTVLPLLFTRRYAAAVPLFAIVTLEMPLWAIPVDALLRAAGRTRFLFGWYAVRIVIMAGAVLGGLRLGGVTGAVSGGVATEVISRVVMTSAGSTSLGVPLTRVLDPGLSRIALAAAIAALPSLIVQRLLVGRPALFVGAAVYLLCYGGLYFALRSVRRAEAAARNVA